MEINFIGHSTLRAGRRGHPCPDRPVPEAEQPSARSPPTTSTRPTCVITHAHQDHFADAVAVAKRTGAACVAISELANVLDEQGIEDFSDPNLGGTVEFDWGWVKLVPALHTSTLPAPRGAVQPEDRHRDRRRRRRWSSTSAARPSTTSATPPVQRHEADRRAHPGRRRLLPIGGHYTMDRHDAVVAAEFIGAETVIPIHYNTFPPIETDAELFKADVESKTARRSSMLGPARARLEVASGGSTVGLGTAPEPTARSFQSCAMRAPPASVQRSARRASERARRRAGRRRRAAIPVAPWCRRWPPIHMRRCSGSNPSQAVAAGPGFVRIASSAAVLSDSAVVLISTRFAYSNGDLP